MKKHLISNLLLVSVVFVLFGCTKDETEKEEEAPDTEIVITVEDFATTIDENEENETSLGTVTASANEGDITFSIKSQTPDGAVSINPTTGELLIADNTAFDYEANTEITGVIEAKVDTETEDINFTITINDVLDSSLVITSDSAFTIEENAASGTVIAVVTATTDSNEALVFSMESVTVDGAIEIDSSTGEIRVVDSSLLDFETLPEIITTIVVTLENTDIIFAQEITIGLIDVIEALTASTFAGSTEGYVDGDISIATFNRPTGMATDAAGNIYVTEYGNHTVRKITPAGQVSTLVGGFNGFADGTGTDAKLFRPTDIIMGVDGFLYVADSWNNRIRKVSLAGVVTTFAGGSSGFVDGMGNAAKFNKPSGLTTDADGNIYVADLENQSVRKITTAGVVSTLAGGTEGYNNGTGSSAQFKDPRAIVLSNNNELMVTDQFGRTVRKVTLAGVVTVFAGNGVSGSSDGVGTSSSFGVPNGITIDNDGNLLVSDRSEHNIRKITPNAEVTTIAGTRSSGSNDGVASQARFYNPAGMLVTVDGTIYIADYDNHRIRVLK
ncbi:NHL domain-containing protein [Algibacter lectus]|uniref:NHL repeat protein n=1 Tax=Algibacter lectus TaxID=221126 RepID=A0A090VEF7_9FLAO|nr:hypothetical protein [Algibacter lectus]GAL61759.1 NHL repeat protein [Algibacter lectus]